MDVTELLLRVALGLVIGFCIGLTGVGGGVLVMPTLTLLLKLDASMAVGTASLYSFLTKVTASYHHYRLKTVDSKTTAIFLAGAIPANIAISAVINRYVKRVAEDALALERFQEGLRMFIAGVILVAATLLVANLVKKIRGKKAQPKPGSFAHVIENHAGFRALVTVAIGILVGALIGATSIGGGVIIIPLFIIFLAMPPSKTVGTSIVIAVILTLITSAAYLIGGQMDLRTAISMAVGSTVGVSFGSKLSVRMPETLLQTIVIGVIIISGILMMFRGAAH